MPAPNTQLQPGQIIAIDFGWYKHLAVVSDRFCLSGKRMLISATQRTGTVLEEPFDVVVKGRTTRMAKQQPNLPAAKVIERARTKIWKWQYCAISRNCEAFANWAGGHGITSRQVNGTVGGAVAVSTAYGLMSESPSLKGLLLFAFLGGAVGLVTTKIID